MHETPFEITVSGDMLIMTTTYYFISSPDDQSVINWFRSQPEVAEEYPNEVRLLLFYRQFGGLAREADGTIDAERSPLVSIYSPKVRRGVIWTVGEVHFLAKGRSLYPGLEMIRRRFEKWLKAKPTIWRRMNSPPEGHGYQLEGSIQNIANVVYAFPDGMIAFDSGRYFVAERDNELVLEKLCRTLRLRGVECT